jgi:hypothetical protein
LNLLLQFFQNEHGTMSMSRLLMFGSFIVTSAIMIKLAVAGEMNEGYFSMYLGAYAGVYLTGKAMDLRSGKVEK